MTRRDLLKMFGVGIPGLIVVHAGIMERDGQKWVRSHPYTRDAVVYLYGRLSMAEEEFHASPAQVMRWIDAEAEHLKHDWIANHVRATSSHEEMAKLWTPSDAPSFLPREPYKPFYEGEK